MGVFRELQRDALERLVLLQDGQGEVERLEVGGEAHARGQALEELPELRFVPDLELHALALGQIENRREAYGPVEVDVKIGLGEGFQDRAAAPGVTPR